MSLTDGAPDYLEICGLISEDGKTLTLDAADFMEVSDDHETLHRANWRHGTTNTIVFPHLGHHWIAKFNVHHEDGWQVEGKIRCHLAHQISKVVKTWEEV